MNLNYLRQCIAVVLIGYVGAIGMADRNSLLAEQLAQAPVTSGSSGGANWEQVVQAARGEKLNLIVMTGSAYADAVAAFQKAYPDIQVSLTQVRPGEFTTRIVTEQKNGQFNWDIFWGPNNALSAVLVPAGALQDIRPYFVRPDVTDQTKWLGGFEIYAQDISKRPFSFLAQMNVASGGFAVNWDRISRGSLKDWQDLLDPKWQGKIVIYGATRPVTGAIDLACALPLVGDDYIRKLFSTQKLVPIDDARLATDWIVRGRYPIVIGLSRTYLPKFQAEGLGKNVEDVGGTVCTGVGGPGLAVFTNAPHPNATKVFLNWLLSKDGQEIYTKIFWPFNMTFSRRVDVAPPDDPQAKAAIEALKNGKSVATGSEKHVELIKRVISISKEYFK